MGEVADEIVLWGNPLVPGWRVVPGHSRLHYFRLGRAVAACRNATRLGPLRRPDVMVPPCKKCGESVRRFGG